MSAKKSLAEKYVMEKGDETSVGERISLKAAEPHLFSLYCQTVTVRNHSGPTVTQFMQSSTDMMILNLRSEPFICVVWDSDKFIEDRLGMFESLGVRRGNFFALRFSHKCSFHVQIISNGLPLITFDE